LPAFKFRREHNVAHVGYAYRYGLVDVAKERYAKVEIAKEEFEQLKKDLS